MFRIIEGSIDLRNEMMDFLRSGITVYFGSLFSISRFFKKYFFHI